MEMRTAIIALSLVLTACGAAPTPKESSPTAPSPAPPPVAIAPPPTQSSRAPVAATVPEAKPDCTVPDERTSAEPAPSPADMLGVPGGTFSMGSDDRGEGDERPAHLVAVAPFLLDKTEVTNAAYGECVSAGACRKPATGLAERGGFGPTSAFTGPDQPVSGVSWQDAADYCRFRGRRLPTEAEWERASRGSDGRLFPWGDAPPDSSRAVYGGRRTANVGSKPAGKGPYGHLDLAGNVWEWMADDYDPYAYRRDTAGKGLPADCSEILAAQDDLRRAGKQGFTGTNPIPTSCEKVLRGGAFNYGGAGLRASNRVHHPGAFRLIMSGFRCAANWPGGPSM